MSFVSLNLTGVEQIVFYIPLNAFINPAAAIYLVYIYIIQTSTALKLTCPHLIGTNEFQEFLGNVKRRERDEEGNWTSSALFHG